MKIHIKYDNIILTAYFYIEFIYLKSDFFIFKIN